MNQRSWAAILAGATGLAVTALATATAAAQGPGQSGFHFAVALGGGQMAITCGDCSRGRTNDYAMFVRAGGAVSPGVVLSGKATGWAHRDAGTSTRAGWLNLVAQIYPNPAGGFYLEGGVGLGRVSADVNRGVLGTARLAATGPGLEGGAGFDIHLSPAFSLTPYVSYLYQAKGRANINGTAIGEQLGANMIHFGFAASWR